MSLFKRNNGTREYDQKFVRPRGNQVSNHSVLTGDFYREAIDDNSKCMERVFTKQPEELAPTSPPMSKEDLRTFLKQCTEAINNSWINEANGYRVYVGPNNQLIIYHVDSLQQPPKEDVLQFGTSLKSTLTPDQGKLQELVANTRIRTSKQAEQGWRDAAKQVSELLDEKAGKPFQYFSLKATNDRVEPEQLIPAVITGILDELEDETRYSIVDDRLVMTSNVGSFVIEAEAFVKMPPIWNPESSQFVYGPGVSESPSDSAKQIIEKSLPVLRDKIPAKLHEKLVQWCQSTTSTDYINALRTKKQAKYPSADELVFLGGTVVSNWREAFCQMIDVPYFNPVVDDWNSEAQATEERMKTEASVLMYAITAKHTGFYSFVEMTTSAFQNPDKTIVVAFLEHDGPFTGASRTSNNAIAEMLGKLPNVKVFFSRVATAKYINSRKDEVIDQN